VGNDGDEDLGATFMLHIYLCRNADRWDKC